MNHDDENRTPASVSDAYRAQREQPPAALDAAILSRARAAATVNRSSRWRIHGREFALAATVVLGIAVASLMVYAPNEPMPDSAPSNAPALAPAEAPAEAPAGGTAEGPVDLPAGSPVAPAAPAADLMAPVAQQRMEAPVPVSAKSAREVPAPAPAPAYAPAALAPPEPIAAPIVESGVALDRAEVSGPRLERAQLEGASAAASAEKETAARATQPRPAPRTLEAMLADYERLRAAGKREAAAASLQALCRAYPDAAPCH